MADREEPQESKEPLFDGSFLNDFITLYLYGVYTFRKGQLTPPEAMQKVVQMSQTMEKAGDLSNRVKKRLAAFCGKKE
ncbi:MAG: hypothetical protein QGG64_06165 [Candidatus Latescibacteria bacterium]|nr:hypothetical protein [Candidatus Latescibacterota bacterium]